MKIKEEGGFEPEMRLRAICHGEILVPTGLFDLRLYNAVQMGPLIVMGTPHHEAMI